MNKYKRNILTNFKASSSKKHRLPFPVVGKKCVGIKAMLSVTMIRRMSIREAVEAFTQMKYYAEKIHGIEYSWVPDWIHQF